MTTFKLDINDATRSVDAAPETPLLWVLRDTLYLVGTKFGCGVGQCGACTVHLDGRPTRACLTPVSSIGSIIEGLHVKGEHPLQTAWQQLDIQSGHIVRGNFDQYPMIRIAEAPVRINVHFSQDGLPRHRPRRTCSSTASSRRMQSHFRRHRQAREATTTFAH